MTPPRERRRRPRGRGVVTRSDAGGSALAQAKKAALVLDAIHYADVTDALLAARPASLADWAWHRQLRYYADGGAGGAAGGGVTVRMAEAGFSYSWEYQGNAPRLVYTPLTDKCYLTLTQGLALGYGGNPYGPAGTGKTESVKALGQALARQARARAPAPMHPPPPPPGPPPRTPNSSFLCYCCYRPFTSSGHPQPPLYPS